MKFRYISLGVTVHGGPLCCSVEKHTHCLLNWFNLLHPDLSKPLKWNGKNQTQTINYNTSIALKATTGSLYRNTPKRHIRRYYIITKNNAILNTKRCVSTVTSQILDCTKDNQLDILYLYNYSIIALELCASLVGLGDMMIYYRYHDSITSWYFLLMTVK